MATTSNDARQEKTRFDWYVLSRISPKAGNAQPDPWIIGAVAFSLVLALTRLSHAPLWHDEVETAIWVGLSPIQVLQTVIWRVPFGRYDPYHLPFYFALVTAWSKMAGISEWSLRLPSVIFFAASVPLIAAIARTLVDQRAARRAAWLAALSPFLLHHAQEARMYALVCLLSAASVLMLCRFLSGRTAKLGIGFAIINVALLATHYYGFFVVTGELAALVLLSRERSSWMPAALACGIVAVGFLCVALFLSPHTSGEQYELGLTSIPGVFWAMISGYALMPSANELHASGMKSVFPYLPYALVAIVPFFVIVIGGIRTLSIKWRLVILLVLASALLGPFLAYAFFPRISINPRYFMAAEPMLLVLLAAGMSENARTYVKFTSSLILIGIMAIGLTKHVMDPGQKREDVIAAGRWLDAMAPDDEEILITSDEMASLAYYHWPKRHFRLYPSRRVVVNAKNASDVVSGMSFSPASNRLIYIFGRTWLSDPDDALYKALLKRYATCPGAEVRGIRIYCFRRS